MIAVPHPAEWGLPSLELKRPVTVLIPAFGAAEDLSCCLASLAEHLPCGCSLLVLDDGTPDDSIRSVCERFRNSGLQYIRSDENRGFVSTCNWGYRNFWGGKSDLLLLNSDTEVTAGFLQEMQAVLNLSERHGVVNPRSNNATIFSIPALGRRLPPGVSFEIWSRTRHLLNRYQVMPTAVGFCMLIKGELLPRFDLFDEIYSPGYNEENDFVCRINRRGYSAIAANWAYVFHKELSSFGYKREALETEHQVILTNRYPEYQPNVNRYFASVIDPIETYLALYRPHRPRILYDLSHLDPFYNGTSEFGLSLLRELSCLIGSDCDLYVNLGVKSCKFFARDLQGYQLYKEMSSDTRVFDLAFKPAQIFRWEEFKRLTRLAPRICFTIQDIIAARCGYLSSSSVLNTLRKTTELADRVFTISECSRSDFHSFFGMDTAMKVIYHGSNFSELGESLSQNKHVLVIGNELFAHKGVEDAIAQLGTEWPIIVVGAHNTDSTSTPPNIRRLKSGNIPRQHMRQLFLQASVVIYPSHYEGFGLPILDSLALGIPVIALDTAVNREVHRLTGDPNLHLLSSLKELNAIVNDLISQPPGHRNSEIRTWKAAGREYARIFREMLSSEIDVAKVRARWDFVRSVDYL